MLRVQIESLVAGIDGAETIMTTETATIGNLIAGFVFERRLRPEIVADLSLQDARGNVLKHHRSVSSYELKDGDKVYLAKNDPRVLLGCRNWFALAVAALLISLIGFGVVIYMYSRTGVYPFDYVVVIDGGSTHTDLYVFQWHGNKFRGTGLVEQVARTRCESRGLENYPEAMEAAKSLNGCLNFASQKVPLASLSSTEIYLGATAGMRLLQLTNATASNAIMDAVHTLIRGNYGFQYSAANVGIITGDEEAADGWMTTNFLAKTLPSEHKPFSYGALDLGGASTQIAFVPYNTTQSNSTTTLELFSQTYELYTQSYLCYGLREAERRLKASLITQQPFHNYIENPCQPLLNTTVESWDSIFGHYCTRDFPQPGLNGSTYSFHGSSNSTACRQEVEKLFNTSSCPYAGCSFDGVSEPPLYGSYMAFSGFYSTMEFLNLTSEASPSSVHLQAFRDATDTFCAKNWTEISGLNASDPHSPFLTMYCFDAHFVDALLTTGYGFTNATFTDIKFAKDILQTSVGWPLGLALNSTNARNDSTPMPMISTTVFAMLMVLFAVLLVFAFVFLVRAYRVARRHRNYEPMSTYGAI
ncbi:Ectonucleoside triphosphate diphosphohydrolase 1 [Hypsibius exemplaris]|uniref:Ectonucleoside triphosphate diphosphohydrolase 1 n=1 Tax=Hypsibius exemplaris TaxID=2072580 RepID=A0A1W0WTM1_HYPEX|nr:Ectonucleoside triphosphate diphosphohydrolase 1 [Hypsibius exemplaris]